MTALGTFANFYMVNDVRRCNSRRIVNTRFEIMRMKSVEQSEKKFETDPCLLLSFTSVLFFFFNEMLFFIALTKGIPIFDSWL